MAKVKMDGIVLAVHYKPDGWVDWVRAYIRRGATFSDRVMLNRQTLVGLIKSGKRIYIGERIPLLASTFEVSDQLRVLEHNDKEILVVGDQEAERDQLIGVPLI